MAPSPMYDTNHPLFKLFCPAALDAMARETGVVRRLRHVVVPMLVLALVMSGSEPGKRCLEAVRQRYERLTVTTLARSSFWYRLTPALAEMMHALVLRALPLVSTALRFPRGALSGFSELLALDSTVVRLHRFLSGVWPACRTNHSKSAIKLHLVMRVADASAVRVLLTGERKSDAKVWTRVGPWVAGRLLLLDLGYYDFNLFARIQRNGGYFLSRAKSNFNPVLHEAHRVWPGRAIPIVGRTLRDVLPELERQVLDAKVVVRHTRRRWRGHAKQAELPLRLVAVRDEHSGEYHSYLTNIPPEKVPAEDIRDLYRLRWQVELAFKAMKSAGQLEVLPTENEHVVKILVWASVLATLLSQAFYRLVRARVAAGRFMPPLRWARLFARFATSLLTALFCQSGDTLKPLLDLMAHEAEDPNLNRKKRAFPCVPELMPC